MVENSIALGDSPSSLPIESYGVDFIEICQRTVTMCKLADVANGSNVSVHGIDGLESDDLCDIGIRGFEQAFEMVEVVMPPDVLGSGAVPYAFDHGGVIVCVGEDFTTPEYSRFRQHAQHGLIGDVAGREKQCSLLVVKVCELMLKFDVIMRCSGDISSSARARARSLECFVHSLKDDGILSHSKIVVGAPYGDRVCRSVVVESCGREIPLVPDDVRKDPIPPFLV